MRYSFEIYVPYTTNVTGRKVYMYARTAKAFGYAAFGKMHHSEQISGWKHLDLKTWAWKTQL